MLGSKPDVLSILPHPKAPGSLEEAGLSIDLILQLVLKTLHFVGELSGADIAKRLGVKFSVIDPARMIRIVFMSIRSLVSYAVATLARPVTSTLP